MKANYILYGLYIICLIGCVTIGLYQRMHLHQPLKIILLLVATGLLTEIAAGIGEYLTGSNLQVYNVTDVMQAIVVHAYFSSLFGRPAVGVGLAFFTVLLGSYTHTLLGRDEPVNNYFLLWFGLSTIALSLYSIVRLHHHNSSARLIHLAHFWVAAAMIMYWLLSFFYLLMFNTLMQVNVNYVVLLNVVNLASNILSCAVVAFVFYRTPQLIQ